MTDSGVSALARKLMDLDNATGVDKASRTDRMGDVVVAQKTITLANANRVGMIVGEQEDGSFAIKSLWGPTPGVPTNPNVSAAVGGMTVRWDGNCQSGQLYSDFSCIEIHACPYPSNWDFTYDKSNLVGRITFRGNQMQFVALPNDNVFYVYLVACNTSGICSGPSGYVSVSRINPSGVADYGTKTWMFSGVERRSGLNAAEYTEFQPTGVQYAKNASNGSGVLKSLFTVDVIGGRNISIKSVGARVFIPSASGDVSTGNWRYSIAVCNASGSILTSQETNIPYYTGNGIYTYADPIGVSFVSPQNMTLYIYLVLYKAKPGLNSGYYDLSWGTDKYEVMQYQN